MRQLPYGYEIENGIVVVNEENAQILRTMVEGYISGMSLQKCAEAVGMSVKHSTIMKMLTNRKYLGTDIFPPILSAEVMDEVKAEKARRSAFLGRDNLKSRKQASVYEKQFSVPPIPVKYKDPIKQAEYAYCLIQTEVKQV